MVGSLIKCFGVYHIVLGTEKDNHGETMMSTQSLDGRGTHMFVKLEGNPLVEVISESR